ncbi:DUF2752 domain-containing protein [Paenibacillus paeoniae]|uniref:DUF2752 domain-containing protein n=1 Tax=Paenibacillus paeoniae TaxID=2292705 RepID=A0A371P7D4_9BACL|nr:DUF2752 domain-containing protein [Paenibacillus paeoniae]REK71861.1 DUF2752 domain-containing protein [Paenibacillus paeoniae]
MSTKWQDLKELPKRHPRLFWGTMLGAGGLLYAKVWLPVTGLAVPCPFHAVTGLYCPGCGVTRAALSLLDMDVYQAFRFNSLIFILAPMLALYAWANAKKKRRISGFIVVFMISLTLIYGLARNLPPWSYLAPTDLS